MITSRELFDLRIEKLYILNNRNSVSMIGQLFAQYRII